MSDNRHKSETEAKILEAAHTVFLRRGTAGARMQEIADEAGVNKALLHYYYRSKANLARAVFKRAFPDLIRRLAEVLARKASIEEKVEAITHEYIGFAQANPYLPGYVICELNHHPERIEEVLTNVHQHVTPALEKLAAQIEARVEAGEMRPIAPEQFVVNLVSLCLFPFIARPMLKIIFGMDDERSKAFIEARKQELPTFVLNALKPRD